MSRHSIRVELPDLPGALAKVATVVSELNGDVVSVDVHEVDGNNAVDELVVEFLTGLDPGALADALDRGGAGRLLACSPADERADPVVEALQWARELVAAPAPDEVATLERVLGEACPAAAVWVAPIDEARAVAAGRLALVRSLPVVQRAEEMPPGFGVDAPGPVWLLAVADGHQPTRAIAFLARPISLRFTASEVARVHALTAIARALAPRAPVTPPAPPASSAPTPAPAG
jgi:hypothetical protein